MGFGLPPALPPIPFPHPATRYDPGTDKYVPFEVWVNAADPSDFINCPALVSREKREREFAKLVAATGISVDAAGHCQRDWGAVVGAMYAKYAEALRPISSYTPARPAMPVLYLDATGASLGRGLTHVECGCADFMPPVFQSRATMGPLAMWGGSDKAVPIRANCDRVLPGFNAMRRSGTLTVGKGTAAECTVPCRPIASADMQGTKSLFGMRTCSHSVWCKCQGGAQHQYPKQAVQSRAEMEAAIADVGCEMKTLEEMVRWSHFSWGVYMGGAFTPINCECCGYDPTEAEWRADLAAWEGLSDDARKLVADMHNESNGAQCHTHTDQPEPEGPDDVAAGEPNAVRRHYYQELFTPPAAHLPMRHAGVDTLHLVYLNTFKHLFNHTVHACLPSRKKKLVAAYLKYCGFYSYDAAVADEENPVMRWIGREVKKFLAEADVHLPFLLRLAHAPAELVPEVVAGLVVGAEGLQMDSDSDSEYEPTEQERQDEIDAGSTLEQDAQMWDNFIALVRAVQTPWDPDDTDEYRETRAVEAFNLGAPQLWQPPTLACLHSQVSTGLHPPLPYTQPPTSLHFLSRLAGQQRSHHHLSDTAKLGAACAVFHSTPPDARDRRPCQA